MTKRRMIFEHVCDNLYESQHSQFLTEFQNEIYPLFEDLVAIEQMRTARYPLMEQEGLLSADQIRAIFKAAEIASKDTTSERFKRGASKFAGDARDSAAGKMTKKTANKMGEQFGKLVNKYQNLPPIKHADTKFEDLKKQIIAKTGGKNSTVNKAIEVLGHKMQNNPKTTNAIIGALTAAASLAGSPAAGAAVGSGLKALSSAIKGDKLSSIAAKSAVAGALGGALGNAEELVDMTDNVEASGSEQQLHKLSSNYDENRADFDGDGSPDMSQDDWESGQEDDESVTFDEDEEKDIKESVNSELDRLIELTQFKK